MLFRAPCLPWGVWCKFRAGLTAFVLLGAPFPRWLVPPPTVQERVIVDYMMARSRWGFRHMLPPGILQLQPWGAMKE